MKTEPSEKEDGTGFPETEQSKKTIIGFFGNGVFRKNVVTGLFQKRSLQKKCSYQIIQEILQEISIMEPILCYEHVDISYNGVPAVRDVSFSVGRGEILGIAGESGSGKSTLIRAAMGLLGETGLVTRGDILYRGKNLPDLPAREMQKLNGPGLGMIFQNAGSSFCGIRRIGAQLYESLASHESVTRAESDRRAVDLLEKLGFEDGRRILDSYPFELSGGMQQRVGIAAAMLMHPDVLFADEPTSALDASVQKQVVEEMLLVREAFGTAIVLVTHNIGVIRAMADRILVMKDGRMVEYGEAAQVLGAPKAPYTKLLLSAVPRLRR